MTAHAMSTRTTIPEHAIDLEHARFWVEAGNVQCQVRLDGPDNVFLCHKHGVRHTTKSVTFSQFASAMKEMLDQMPPKSGYDRISAEYIADLVRVLMRPKNEVHAEHQGATLGPARSVVEGLSIVSSLLGAVATAMTGSHSREAEVVTSLAISCEKAGEFLSSFDELMKSHQTT